MDELRWALLGLGALFLGGLAWWELRRPRHAPGGEEARNHVTGPVGLPPTATMTDLPAGRRLEPSFGDGGDHGPGHEEDYPRIRTAAPDPDPQLVMVDELRETSARNGISLATDVAVDEPSAARDVAFGHPGERSTHDHAIHEHSIDERPTEGREDEPWIDEAALAEAAVRRERGEVVDFDISADAESDPTPTMPAADASSTVAGTDAGTATSARRAPAEPEWPPEEQRRIISLRVAPRPPNRFPGRTLRLAFQACGLEYGAMDVFHLADDEGRVFASAANLMRPGTFKLDTMDSQHFHGVHLFSVLPGPLPAGRAVDELIGLARDIAQRTSGIVLDHVGQPLDEERAAQLRAEAVEAERAG